MMKYQFIWDGESKKATYGGRRVDVVLDKGGLGREALIDWIEKIYMEKDFAPRIDAEQAQWLLEESAPPTVTCTLPLKNNLLVKELGELA